MCGYSQKGLAECLGVSQSTICLYESGASFPNNEELSHMASLFDIKRSELFNTEGELENLNSKVEDMTPGEIEEVIRYAEYIKWKR